MERRLGALVVAVVALSAAAGALYQWLSGRERPLPSSGFDLQAVSAPDPAASSAPAPPRSGLGMVETLPGLHFGSTPPPDADQTPGARPDDVRAAVSEAEGPVAALARDYTRRYPVIREYGRDWMSHPDLKRLNDDYMRRHDPVAFLLGLAQAPSFPPLVKKYAAQKPFRDFVLDAVKAAPAGAVSTALERVNADARMKALADGVGAALGFPPQALAQAAATGGPVKLDDAQLAKIVRDARAR